MKPEEADLIDRCKRQEPGAFEELYRLHAGRVYNLACRMTGSLSDGEDLMQDIFVQVFRKLDGFKGESAVGTWIYRLATNQCLDYLRGREAKARKLTDSIEHEGALPRTRHAPGSGRPRRPGAGDCPAASGLSRGVRAARRGGLRAPGGGQHPGNRGRHLEVAGAQGAHEDSRVSRRCAAARGGRPLPCVTEPGEHPCIANGTRTTFTG